MDCVMMGRDKRKENGKEKNKKIVAYKVIGINITVIRYGIWASPYLCE